MPLPFEHPPLMPDETLQGFVGRIARHYATDVVEYCNVVGIRSWTSWPAGTLPLGASAT